MRFFSRLWGSIKLSFTYLKIMPQLIIGAWKITRLPQPVVSVFGGSRLPRGCTSTNNAAALSAKLVSHEISIITGGGPGIMEAANCAAFHTSDKNENGVQERHEIHTMGIGVRGIATEDINPCVKDFVLTDYFSMREYLLIYYSYAYVIFPGGFGTLDELTEVITLMQTKRLARAPIILFNKDYWSNLMLWVERAVKEGLIPGEHVDYLILTDDVDEAAQILIDFCELCPKRL